MIPIGTLLGPVQVSLPGAPIIGQVDQDGRLINLGKLEGWWDPPPNVGTSIQKPNDHGAYLTPGYYGPRVINLEARVDGLNPGDSLAAAQRLVAAISVDQLVQLSVTDELGTLTAMVRQEGDPVTIRKGNRVTVSLSLLAPRPARYSLPGSVETLLPTTSGGFSLGGGNGASLPISLGATTVSGTVTIVNTAASDGGMDGRLVFTAFGPLSPFSITDQGGRQLYYPGSLAAGRTLVLDCNERTARADGTQSRTVVGTWPRLAPGVNQFTFTANVYDPASRLVVAYQLARK